MKEDKHRDYFKTVEVLLYNYKQLESRIENLATELNRVKKADGYEIAAIAYDNIPTGKTYNISRVLQNKTLSKIELENELNIMLYREKKLKSKIDRAISNLSPIHQQIVLDKYKNGLEWNIVADNVHLEERQVRRKKTQAIKCIANELFGWEALEQQLPLLQYVDI